MTADQALPRKLTFSGKYAPNGRSQDNGKDYTADHDHDLLLLVTRREMHEKWHHCADTHSDKKETDSTRHGGGTERTGNPEGKWMDLACAENIPRLET